MTSMNLRLTSPSTPPHNSHALLNCILFLFSTLLLQACTSQPVELVGPRIFSIGEQSIVTFTTDKDKSVFIPITGDKLGSWDKITIRVIGDIPATPGIDYNYAPVQRNSNSSSTQPSLMVSEDYQRASTTRPNLATEPPSKSQKLPTTQGIPTTQQTDEYDTTLLMIQLRPEYIAKLHTGDHVRVLVTIVHTDPKDAGNTVLSVATRTFTLYSLDDYRTKYQNSRIAVSDIRAFPLSNKEAESLFGPTISQTYFVVKLSIQNTDQFDKVVNTGMIQASGRALVQPQKKPLNLSNGEEKRVQLLRFTVPVDVNPQSGAQVYNVLEGQEPYQLRNVIFSSLEFGGAIASAYTAGYNAGPDAIKAASLFTGVVIPESAKLWNDPEPAYKRNVVNLAMPDLIKVPRNTVTSHKYLFFPKSRLETIIADPTLFGGFQTTPTDAFSFAGLEGKSLAKGVFTPPNISLIYLQFDTLDIPFDIVVPDTLTAVHDRLRLAEAKLDDAIRQLSPLSSEWVSDDGQPKGEFLSILTAADIVAADGDPKAKTTGYIQDSIVQVNQNKGDASTVKALASTIQRLQGVAKSIDLNDPNSQYYKDLLADESPSGLPAANRAKKNATDLGMKILQGTQIDPNNTVLSSIEDTATKVTNAVEAYRLAAAVLAPNAEVRNAVMILKSKGSTATLPTLLQSNSLITATLQKIVDARDGLQIIPALVGTASASTAPAPAPTPTPAQSDTMPAATHNANAP